MLEGIPAKRRNVLKGLFGVSLASFAAPILYVVGKFVSFQNLGGKDAIAKLSAADLTPDSPAKLVQINGEPIIVVRETNNEIRAFTATCTHLGCTVSYKPQQPGFFCKCHQGRYDENGVNVPGTRPQRPLTELTLSQQADDLEVTLIPKKKA